MKQEMQDVLEKNILRFWLDKMVDHEHGGFYGRIDGNGVLHPEAEKGAILNARILWAFSAAYRVFSHLSPLTSYLSEYLEAATRAKDYLKQYADTTKADGSFEIKAKDRPTEYMRVFVRDIDGPSNGNYQNDVINVEFTSDEVKSEGQGWNRGVAQKENFNIKLKPVR